MDIRSRIKKTIIFCGRMIPMSLTVYAVFSMSDVVHNVGSYETVSLSVNNVFAQQQATEALPLKDETKSSSTHDSGLMNNLLEKQKQLDNREKILKEEERKMEALRRDLVEKMEALRAMEEKMTPSLEVQKADKDKKYQALAKMYEATPAEKASTIFEKMDRKMAAEIMLRMNSKKAGAVWANINRDIGVEIVREITATHSIDAAIAKRIAQEITGTEVIKPETKQRVVAESTPKAVPKIAASKRDKPKNSRSEVFKPYAIQIKAVRDIQVAKEYTKILKEEGNDAYWSRLNVKDGGTLYRIFVGHFASREEALTYMKKKDIVSNYPGSYIQKNEQVLPEKKKKRK
jgi:flagellar motility protein MotE (MotC chaperone)